MQITPASAKSLATSPENHVFIKFNGTKKDELGRYKEKLASLNAHQSFECFPHDLLP